MHFEDQAVYDRQSARSARRRLLPLTLSRSHHWPLYHYRRVSQGVLRGPERVISVPRGTFTRPLYTQLQYIYLRGPCSSLQTSRAGFRLRSSWIPSRISCINSKISKSNIQSTSTRPCFSLWQQDIPNTYIYSATPVLP